jgi:site-specific DNA-methyltransferase (adenine-specific)
MSACTLEKLDAVEWLKTIESESVDLIITDPPYESLEKHRAKGTTTRLKISKGSSNVWFDIFPNERFPELFREVFRVLKKNSHFYLFCDQETMFVVKPMAEDVGFKFWKPLVWDKQKIGMGYHYRARYEFILFFEKGKRKLKNLGIPDVLCEDRIRGGYPTEKPANLSKILIEQSSDEGDLVIDPFFGSGSVGAACSMSNRNFQGADISDYAHDLASERLKPNVKAETEMENNTKADIINTDDSEKKTAKQFIMEFA